MKNKANVCACGRRKEGSKKNESGSTPSRTAEKKMKEKIVFPTNVASGVPTPFKMVDLRPPSDQLILVGSLSVGDDAVQDVKDV